MAFMDSFFNNLQVSLGGFHTPEVLKRIDEDAQNAVAYYESHPSVENNKILVLHGKLGRGTERNLTRVKKK